MSVSTISPKARGWSTLGPRLIGARGRLHDVGRDVDVGHAAATATVPIEFAGTAERSPGGLVLLERAVLHAFADLLRGRPARGTTG